MDPINYAVDVATPFQTALQGYQAGAAIRNDQQQQALQQQAFEQQKRLQALVTRASQPGATADDFQAVMIADPKHAEAYTKAWATKNTAQQQSLAGDLLQWGAAIKSGKPALAVERMIARADAMEASGGPTQESKGLRIQAQLVQEHPEFALGQFQALLAVNPNGKDAAETLSKFGSEARAQELQPGLVAKGQADASKAGSDATKAAVDARFAEQNAVLDIQKKGWDIKAIQEDIGFKREANRIAMMNAAAAREGNALKREELGLKIQEARNALDTKIRDKVSQAETGAASIDNMLNTIERVKTSRGLDAALGSISSRLPTVMQDTADAEALVETLGSQAFLAQIPNIKGMGALSNAEGEKLTTALQSLSLKQSPTQFRTNLGEAARLLKKGREALSRSTGVPLGAPDTPAAPGARPPLDSFNQSTGGASGSY